MRLLYLMLLPPTLRSEEHDQVFVDFRKAVRYVLLLRVDRKTIYVKVSKSTLADAYREQFVSEWTPRGKNTQRTGIWTISDIQQKYPQSPRYTAGRLLLPIKSSRVLGGSHLLFKSSANHYPNNSSAVYRFTCLGRLKDNFAWFNREIITIG